MKRWLHLLGSIGFTARCDCFTAMQRGSSQRVVLSGEYSQQSLGHSSSSVVGGAQPSSSRRNFFGATMLGTMAAPDITKAMWQQWTPDDMLTYVERYGHYENSTSVLAAMDKAAETSWMMNMGPEKAKFIADLIADLQPRSVLEIGTFLGYMTISMAQALADGSRIVTIEKDETNHAAATLIMKKALAGFPSGRVGVDSWLGPSSSVLESPEFQRLYPGGGSRKGGGSGSFDLVLMDHWKPEYAADLKRLEKLGLIRKGTVVLADNALFPGAPELLAYLGVPFGIATDEASGQECLTSPLLLPNANATTTGAGPMSPWVQSAGWKTRLVPVPFEYRPLTPDAISYSVRM